MSLFCHADAKKNKSHLLLFIFIAVWYEFKKNERMFMNVLGEKSQSLETQQHISPFV